MPRDSAIVMCADLKSNLYDHVQPIMCVAGLCAAVSMPIMQR